MGGPTYSWLQGYLRESNIADGPSRDDYEGFEVFDITIPVCIYSLSLVEW